ncbi:E3 ubiquitin/ISG15 ligase TRIM25 [Frankliniella fusca]|uniref:E3 ubiquitin/ISG15 ligase TRIM25 n=1 Tax=Frankliniella fusca TaxID=407009 RepID=A0AAE1HAE3_9NEOP|nr:E3 ubiquitin/ISG15 ligase TRIM25 [Frankliniella fusca]
MEMSIEEGQDAINLDGLIRSTGTPVNKGKADKTRRAHRTDQDSSGGGSKKRKITNFFKPVPVAPLPPPPRSPAKVTGGACGGDPCPSSGGVMCDGGPLDARATEPVF